MSINTSDKAWLSIYADRYHTTINLDYKIGNNNQKYKLIFGYVNNTNGYKGYAYKSNIDNKIYVIHAGSNELNTFQDMWTYDGFQD